MSQKETRNTRIVLLIAILVAIIVGFVGCAATQNNETVVVEKSVITYRIYVVRQTIVTRYVYNVVHIIPVAGAEESPSLGETEYPENPYSFEEEEVTMRFRYRNNATGQANGNTYGRVVGNPAPHGSTTEIGHAANRGVNSHTEQGKGK